METIKLGVIGSCGRMGMALCDHLERVSDIETVAEADLEGVTEEFLATQMDVVIDLSVGSAVDDHGEQVVRAGFAYIVGATGYAGKTVELLKTAAADSGKPVLIVPNFSLGANLMIKFAQAAAVLMDSPVIAERHHQRKIDAPSGTARFTAERIAQVTGGQEGNGQRGGGIYSESTAGVLGGTVAGVPIHSVRGAGFLAEQDVTFSLPGESLRVEHRSIDRSCFMPGIKYAIRNIGRVEGLQVGLDTILDV